MIFGRNIAELRQLNREESTIFTQFTSNNQDVILRPGLHELPIPNLNQTTYPPTTGTSSVFFSGKTMVRSSSLVGINGLLVSGNRFINSPL